MIKCSSLYCCFHFAFKWMTLNGWPVHVFKSKEEENLSGEFAQRQCGNHTCTHAKHAVIPAINPPTLDA